MGSDVRSRQPDPQTRPASERSRLSPRTIPEQIADHLGMAILHGDYRDGERIGEQEVADRYGVSRGPVREAIRMLERRGLLSFEPRRGAFAIGISLDLIADLFNTRAALLGLAGRCFARAAPKPGLEQLTEGLARLHAIAPTGKSDAAEFALAVGRAAAAIYDHCGNLILTRMLREQGETSLWDLIWRERPLDYFTSKRRASCLEHFAATERAVRAADEIGAEARLRSIVFESRDSVLATLVETRGGSVDRAKLLG